MRSRGIDGYEEYGRLLARDPAEYLALSSSLSITVTDFFRDKDLFSILQSKIIPSISTSKSISKIPAQKKKLQIWCAGCATGEEPYSVAMLIHNFVAQNQQIGIAENDVTILATDRNPSSIQVAKEGTYPEATLKNVPSELKSKYFHQIDFKIQQSKHPNAKPTADLQSYQVDQKLKELINFETSDLTLMYPKMESFDLILCRNVMIYLDKRSRDRLLSKFHWALKSDGYFIVGQSEIILGGLFKLFKPIFTNERVYQKHH
jgi:chemotaxis protein methyltransferase CheR